MAKREIRIRQIPTGFKNGQWETKPQGIVRLGDVGRWSVVRVAAYPQAMPFTMSRKDWDRLPIA